jgi:hypothetical protein
MRRKAKQKPGKTPCRPSAEKVSEMVSVFAGEFINLGASIEEKQNRLNAACSAWNMACEPPRVREKLLGRYVKEYKRYNPDTDDEDLVAVRSNMEKLIGNKLRLFPNVRKQVLGAQITRVGSKDRINVLWATLPQERWR